MCSGNRSFTESLAAAHLRHFQETGKANLMKRAFIVWEGIVKPGSITHLMLLNSAHQEIYN